MFRPTLRFPISKENVDVKKNIITSLISSIHAGVWVAPGYSALSSAFSFRYDAPTQAVVGNMANVCSFAG